MTAREPIELVFSNPVTNRFAVLDKRLLFDKSVEGSLYIQIAPKAPRGLSWEKIVRSNGEDVSKRPNCVSLDTLLKELYQENPDKTKNYIHVFKCDNCEKCLRQFTMEPTFYGNLLIAQQVREEQGSPRGFSTVIMRYEQDLWDSMEIWGTHVCAGNDDDLITVIVHHKHPLPGYDPTGSFLVANIFKRRPNLWNDSWAEYTTTRSAWREIIKYLAENQYEFEEENY